MSDWNEKIIQEFRENEGRVGGHFANNTLLLLHTTGAKSGKQRINPAVTMEDGERLVVIASKGGADTHHAWYHNIVANPEVEVEYGTERFAAQATVATEPERSELYDKMAGIFPGFDDYRTKTSRVIPVITITRSK